MAGVCQTDYLTSADGGILIDWLKISFVGEPKL